MKRCLNCRQTYEDTFDECPYCGYKPRTKNIATKRFERTRSSGGRTAELPNVQSAPKKQTAFRGKNISAASNHSGAFYIKSGERLNKRYSVISVMGFGTFGVAYECFDNYSKQHVVVKEYMPSYLVTRSTNGRDVEPISDEAEVKFQIGCDSFIDENEKMKNHNVECVPELIECFRQNNTAYAATALVGGESLSSILNRKGKLSYETTAGIITSVLQGLRRLNKVGVIHGDICPENIIVVSEDKTYLLDYNLSDFNKKMYTQRESGKPRPGYSALELYYKNLEIGPWTDVYAAAAVMYRMLTGILIPTAVKRSSGDTLTPVSKLGVPISAGAERAMLKALKVKQEKRTQSPEDFLNGFVGDGFDNITAVKNKGSNAPTVASRAPKYKEPRDSSGFLKGLLTFLTLAIVAVVIWFFISGVFPTPQFVTDLLGGEKTSASGTDVKKPDETDEDTSHNTEESKPEDGGSSSSGLFDGIVSRVTSDIASGITNGVSSFIDEHLNQSSEAPAEESSAYDDGNYYDEYGYYDNDGVYHYYSEDNGYGDDNGDYTYTESYEEYTESQPQNDGGYFDGAASVVSGFVDDYLN